MCHPSACGAARPPDGAGFYAWWCRRERRADAQPQIPSEPRPPVDDEWSLLYVGIFAEQHLSRRTVAVRFNRDHSGGMIGNSTFRQSLASLLIGNLGPQPLSGYDRSRLLDEGPLSA